MLLGCVADDFTGASDAANELAKNGMMTTLFIGVPAAGVAGDTEAAVIALKTRSVAPDDAVSQSLSALSWLRGQGVRQTLFKYCSTFDSTPVGNIGPVGEAMAAALGVKGVVVCPAFPANKRTLYAGHLFVGDRLLNESGMENHPTNPMTDPDIRRWLQLQTKSDVGFVPHAVVRQGSGAITAALEAAGAAGCILVVVDAIEDADLRTIGAAVSGMALVTGGSGIAIGLPTNFLTEQKPQPTPPYAIKGPGLVLSGSVSIASRTQVAEYAKDHAALKIESTALMEGSVTVTDTISWIAEHLSECPMVYSTTEPTDLTSVQKRHGVAKVSARVERFFGEVADAAVRYHGIRRLVVGGGETSGAVVSALGLTSLNVGPEIDPGVPALRAGGDRPLGIVLKSGNFGTPDFFAKALRAIASHE